MPSLCGASIGGNDCARSVPQPHNKCGPWCPPICPPSRPAARESSCAAEHAPGSVLEHFGAFLGVLGFVARCARELRRHCEKGVKKDPPNPPPARPRPGMALGRPKRARTASKTPRDEGHLFSGAGEYVLPHSMRRGTPQTRAQKHKPGIPELPWTRGSPQDPRFVLLLDWGSVCAWPMCKFERTWQITVRSWPGHLVEGDRIA